MASSTDRSWHPVHPRRLLRELEQGALSGRAEATLFAYHDETSPLLENHISFAASAGEELATASVVLASNHRPEHGTAEIIVIPGEADLFDEDVETIGSLIQSAVAYVSLVLQLRKPTICGYPTDGSAILDWLRENAKCEARLRNLRPSGVGPIDELHFRLDEAPTADERWDVNRDSPDRWDGIVDSKLPVILKEGLGTVQLAQVDQYRPEMVFETETNGGRNWPMIFEGANASFEAYIKHANSGLVLPQVIVIEGDPVGRVWLSEVELVTGRASIGISIGPKWRAPQIILECMVRYLNVAFGLFPLRKIYLDVGVNIAHSSVSLLTQFCDEEGHKKSEFLRPDGPSSRQLFSVSRELAEMFASQEDSPPLLTILDQANFG